MLRAKKLFIGSVILLGIGFVTRYKAEDLASRYYQTPDGRERYSNIETVKVYEELGLAMSAIALLLFPVAAHHWCNATPRSEATSPNEGR